MNTTCQIQQNVDQKPNSQHTHSQTSSRLQISPNVTVLRGLPKIPVTEVARCGRHGQTTAKSGKTLQGPRFTHREWQGNGAAGGSMQVHLCPYLCFDLLVEEACLEGRPMSVLQKPRSVLQPWPESAEQKYTDSLLQICFTDHINFLLVPKG